MPFANVDLDGVDLRQIKRLVVTGELLVNMAKRSYMPRFCIPIEHALPDDAMAIGAAYDVELNNLVIFVWSASFAHVPPSERVPILDTPLIRMLAVEEERRDVGARPLRAMYLKP